MKSNKTLFIPILIVLDFLVSCTEKLPNSIELITNHGQQDSIFQHLVTLVGNSLQMDLQNDSLAFLIIPVEASCPSCRKKTIDSVVKHQDNLPSNHYIIVTAGAGRKTMNSYFREQKATIPDIPQIVLDTVNRAKIFELFENNPAIYYSVNRKVFKKVLTLPATVRQDLQEFFSGKRTYSDLAN